MVRISIFLFVFAISILACNRENPSVVNPEPVGDKNWVTSDTGKKTDELKANSVQGGDPKAMMSRALQTLQTAYKAANGKVIGVGEVTVLLDDANNLIIENKSGSSTISTMVNLKSIDTDFKHIEILSDSQGHPSPGFRIKTLPGQPKVEVTKGGSKSEMDYLEVILSERADVQHSLSALTMAAQIAQNTLPIGVDK